MQTTQKELTYKTIEREILRRITSGEYEPGQQLPTERVLEHELGVSRLTIAKGLANLAAAGYITRTQGRGSFVCPKLPQPHRDRRNFAEATGIVKYLSPGSVQGPTIISHGILEGLHTELMPSGSPVCVEFYTTVEQQLRMLQTFNDNMTDGFVIWPALDRRLLPELEKMAAAHFPFVLVDAFFPELNCDYIISDNCLGAEVMINHLFDCGHRRIAYFSAAPDRISLSERLSGVISALSKKGLAITGDTINIIPGGDPVISSFKSAQNSAYLRERLTVLLSSATAPTAIFAGNDWIAMTIYNILDEMGIKVPGEISLAGFDNIDAAQYFRIPLTTMAQNFYEIGRMAGKVILARRTNKPGNEIRYQNRIPPELIVRDSIRKIDEAK